MWGVILAGGRSSRMGGVEKPLLEICGVRMLDIVASVLKRSELEGFCVAVSRNAPKTWEYCKRRGYDFVDTAGRGYHEDLSTLLKKFQSFVSVACDLPFLQAWHVNKLVRAFSCEGGHKGKSITVAVPLKLMPKGFEPSHVFELQVESGDSIPEQPAKLVACGLNVVTDTQNSSVLIFDDPLLAVNVNTPQELELARHIAKQLDYYKVQASVKTWTMRR
ncbi:NTP transferase domain-containing protein [Candidatus Alkanophaga liquidiphilum]